MKPVSHTWLARLQPLFFESPDSFYKVLLVSVTETNLEWQEPEIVVTGSFADIADEAAYRFFGRLVEHPKYGNSFRPQTIKTRRRLRNPA